MAENNSKKSKKTSPASEACVELFAVFGALTLFSSLAKLPSLITGCLLALTLASGTLAVAEWNAAKRETTNKPPSADKPEDDLILPYNLHIPKQ